MIELYLQNFDSRFFHQSQDQDKNAIIHFMRDWKHFISENEKMFILEEAFWKAILERKMSLSE